MKITRYKKAHKYLSFYCNNYGFRRPYQIIIDGTFCFAACQEQINIHDQLPKYLSEIRFLTTKCIIIETEKVAKKTHGALIVIKQFRVHECGHKEPVTGACCVLSMVGKKNDNHYIVASQDRDLQEKLRKIAGVPLLYLHNKAPTLEKPTPISYKKAQTKQDKLFNTSGELKVLDDLKIKTGLKTAVREVEQKIKKKKMKGPNPLSCKKKKHPSNKLRKNAIAETSKKIRKRRKAKLPTEHIKKQQNVQTSN